MKQKTLFHSCFVLLLFLLVQLSFTRCSSDDSPTNRIPVLSINEIATGVSFSQATLEGVVTDNGSNISRCGFLVNTAKGILEKTGIDEASVYEGSRTSNGNVKVTINNLKANTTYYYCLFVVSGNSSIKSSISNFTTEEIAEPTFSKIEVVKIGEDSITVRCRMLNDGGQSIEKLGFDYKLATSQVFTNMPVENFDTGSTDNTFTCAIGPLEPGTTYHFRATGFNGVKYGYSEIAEATTNAKTSPTVSIGTIDEVHIGVNYVMVTGKIEDTGAADITERGFLIGTVSKPIMGMEGVTNVPVYVATNDFSKTIDNLNPSTTYYVRAYAANNPYGTKTQYGYSDPVELTTKGWETPTFSDIVEQLEGTKLRISCTLDNKGINLVERGFCYSSSNTNPDLTQQVVKSESEDNKMTAAFQIQENTPYYIRPYVKYNLTGEEEVYYGTSHTSQRYTFDRPSISEIAHSDVTYNAASLKATVTTNGVTITERGFKWGTSSNPTTKVQATGSEFKVTLGDLKPATTYYYRAYVVYKIDDMEETMDTEVYSFETLSSPEPSLGAVNTSQSANILSLSCQLDDNGVEVSEVGFCWSKSETMPTVKNNPTKGTFTNGYITVSIPVEENVAYYLRAYVKYQVLGIEQVSYSEVESYQSEAYPRPSISSVTHSDVSTTSAKLSATISSNGVDITSKGFKWGTSADNMTIQTVTTDEFVYTLTNLNANTTYYYEAYVTYKIGDTEETQSSSQASCTTQSIAPATVTIPEVSNVGFHEATATSTITSTGDGTVKMKGFVWSSTTEYPTLDDKQGSVELAADAEFKAQVTGLTDATTYYIRAYVVSEGSGQTVTSYSEGGWWISFYTPQMTLPSLSTPSATEITQTTIKVTASLNDGGNTDVTEMGFCWSDQDIDPKDMTNKATVTADNFTVTITDTEKAGNTYYIYAYATNGKGTAYSQKFTATLKYIPGAGDNPRPGKE